MPLQLSRALVIFDIESTGAVWDRDRVIDLAAIRVEPDGRHAAVSFRFNPEMPIPPEATAIHGIRDEDVAGAPLFRDRVDDVDAVFRDADLGGFNICRFDVPLLKQEFKRAGRVFETRGRHMVDAQRIYHMKERRDLTAAVRFYLGEDHAGAHGAMADAEATWRVLQRQLEVYPDLPGDVAAIEQLCFPSVADGIDPEGKLRWDANGEATLGFGRFQGRRLRDMAADRNDRKYLEWMLRQSFGPEIERWVRAAMDDRLPRRGDVPPDIA